MSEIPQPELNFTAQAAPPTTFEQLAEMIRLLGQAGDWMRSKDFAPPWTERTLRAAASESEGRIISGQRGYKLTRLATDEEAKRATAWLRHQAQAMNKRAIEIDLAREALQTAEVSR